MPLSRPDHARPGPHECDTHGVSSTRTIRVLHAPRERVFRALLDPEAIATWRVPANMTAQVHRFDAHVGGHYRISLTYDSPDVAGKTTAHTDTYHGYFQSITDGKQVKEQMEFETDDPDMRGMMNVSIKLWDHADGTELDVLHTGIPPGVDPADNELGWNEALDRLAGIVEHG
ncbi:SRPBCC domain-containing protein [Rhodococcus sp. W8901]|nr:SRPBCC domain-containing protein [Rhodococcus sp. W8901]